jgi:hypothetical protein
MSHNCPIIQDRKVARGSEGAKKAEREKAAAVTVGFGLCNLSHGF